MLENWSGAAADLDILVLLEEEGGAGRGRAGGSGGAAQTHKRSALQGIPTGHEAAQRMAYEQTEKEQDTFAKAMESNVAVKSIAVSIAKRAEAGEAAQQAENRRAAAEYFQQEGVRDIPEAVAFREDMHREILALGRAALESSPQRHTGGAPSTSSGADRVSAALPPRTPTASTAEGNARVTCAFATKAKRALSQRPAFDLTLPSSLEVTEVGLSDDDDEEVDGGATNPLLGSSSDEKVEVSD